MLTENDVLQCLPPEGFVNTYIHHAMKQTTSPLGYHLGTALTILSSTVPIHYNMNYAGDLHPNLFTLLIGRSGEDQKTTAVSIGKNLLKKASDHIIGDYPASPEGLIESLGQKPRQLIPMGEFGKFLSAAQKGYFEPIKTTLTDLWDCESIQRAKASETVRVDNPRLSILAACSLPYLEKHTLAEDWTGGFMGRWLVFYCRRERIDPNPVGDKTLEAWLVQELERRCQYGTVGNCLGLTSNAAQLWSDWFYDIYDRKGLATNITGVLSRIPTMARKIALLYAWDYGNGVTGRNWYMDVDVLFPAIQVAEMHLKSLIGLFDKIADSPDARLRRQVLDAVESNNGRATLGQIIKHIKLKRRTIMEAIEGLLEERTLIIEQSSLGDVYVLDTAF